MKNYYTISIVALTALALVLGGLIIFQKNQAAKKAEALQVAGLESAEDASSEQNIDLGAAKEFVLSVGENTQLFGIAKENPYYGEPPVQTAIDIRGVDETQRHTFFEIFGDVVSVDLTGNVIYISTDAPRPINTDFTPRGPRVLVEDIKVGDRIVASGMYDKNGEADYSDIKFIQISPSLEEIKILREAQGQ